MNTLIIDLSEDRLRALERLSDQLQISPEELVRLSIDDILTRPEETFQRAMEYVLEKNTELYQRLAE